MKKLNNNGWGLGAFIGFLLLFCIAIIIVVIQADNIEIGSQNDKNEISNTQQP